MFLWLVIFKICGAKLQKISLPPKKNHKFAYASILFLRNFARMNWIILILAGLMEVGFTFCLGKTKTATGHELAMWWGGFLAALTLSMYLMAKASESLPLGTVYPVWTGIGAVGAVIVGILFFNEPATFWRLFFITTLIVSIIGLKVLA